MKAMTRKKALPAGVVVLAGLFSLNLACLGSDIGSRQAGEGASPRRPNVLLIGLETLRRDHVGCLGYGKETTPTLDRLAREGVLCTHTVSTSGWTLPSVMSVMTGLYPGAHQTHAYTDRLPDGVTTLAETLKKHGYTTAGFVSNPTIDGQYGFSDGFDLYDDFTVPLDFGLDLFVQHDQIIGDRHLVRTSELVTRAALRWLEKGQPEPFFMFVFYFDPHYDYIPPPPYDAMFDPNYDGDIDGRGIVLEPRFSTRPPDRDLQHLIALYDGEIRYTDDYVAKLLEAFADAGLLENTFVVLFGDHGDEFYEHGKTGHGRTLYREIGDVPLVLWWPSRLTAGKRIDALTSQVDIMPTVLDYLGLPCEESVQGASLRPLIEGKIDKLHETVWAELNTRIRVQAVIGQQYKFVHDWNNDVWELYHRGDDRYEQSNLYGQPSVADTCRTMKAQWERWNRENKALATKLAPEGQIELQLTEQQLQQLKALGYMQ